MTKKDFGSGTLRNVLKAVLLSAQMPCPGCKACAAQGITATIRAIMVTLLLVLTVSKCYTRSCISWQTILGEPTIDERATDISYTEGEQHYWLSGYQTSPYQTGAENSKNAWLLQINLQGEKINDFVIKDSTELIATTIVHQNKNIFVGGNYYTINNPNDKRAWLAHYNGNEIAWMFKKEVLSETKDLLQLPNGDLLTTGYINLDDSLKKSLIIERWSTDGTQVWSRIYGGSKDEEGSALSLINNNTILVAGFTSSSDGEVSKPLGGRDVWLLEIDIEEGDLIKEKNFGGSSNEVAVDIEILPNLQVAILAESLSTNGDISNSIGSGDFWVFKIDEQWEIIWEKSYGGLSPDFPYTMEAFPNGDLLIAGASFSNSNNIPVNNGYLDSWLARLNCLDGSIRWSKVIGGDDADEILALSVVDENQIIAAGNTDSNSIKCKKEKHSNQNVWLLSLDEMLLNTNELIIEEEDLFHYSIQDDYLRIDYHHLQPVEILITDINGKLYYSTSIKNQQTIQINMSSWRSGIYMILTNLKNTSKNTNYIYRVFK